MWASRGKSICWLLWCHTHTHLLAQAHDMRYYSYLLYAYYHHYWHSRLRSFTSCARPHFYWASLAPQKPTISISITLRTDNIKHKHQTTAITHISDFILKPKRRKKPHGMRHYGTSVPSTYPSSDASCGRSLSHALCQ